MTGKEMQTVIDLERNLSVGNEVRIRWTTCNRQFTGLGHVKKINRKSVLVTLNEDVSCQDLGDEPYRKGHTINAPLISNLRGWTCNNRVEPVEADESDPNIHANLDSFLREELGEAADEFIKGMQANETTD